MDLKDIKFDTKEKWKPVKGFEGIYEVSNIGNVYSHRLKRKLKLSLDNIGYVRIGLCKTNRYDMKFVYVHRIVADAFIDNPLKKQFINHKDENKNNNCIENLEWCTHKENMNSGTRNKRISMHNKNHKCRSKKVVCVNTGIEYPSIMEAQRKTKIWASNIYKCCINERKSAGGYKWQMI